MLADVKLQTGCLSCGALASENERRRLPFLEQDIDVLAGEELQALAGSATCTSTIITSGAARSHFLYPRRQGCGSEGRRVS
jgi:hypothetical protein